MKVLGVVLAAVLASYSVDLKGYTLGSKLTQEQAAGVDSLDVGVSVAKTTLAGRDGTMYLTAVNDGRLAAVSYAFDGRMTTSEVKSVVAGLEAKYGIKMAIEMRGKYSEDGFYVHRGEAHTVAVFFNHSAIHDTPYEVNVRVSDVELMRVHDAEKQAVANKDF